MPQYELEGVGPGSYTGLVRATSAEDAVRRTPGVPPTAVVILDPVPDLQGWQPVALDGQPAGRLRLHQRMRFRRD